MTFVLRCRFQWLTNRLTTFPFVPMLPKVPIDHSFSHGSHVLMRCSLQMVYRSVEELTIRFNVTNCKASLTNRTNGTIGEGVLTNRNRLCYDMSDSNG